jgi:hypothetical protein
MTAKSYRFFVCGVVFVFLCMGCENPAVAGNLPSRVNFRFQFIIENSAATAKTISLKIANKIDDYWDIRPEPRLEGEASPINMQPGESGAMEITNSSGDVDLKNILSFVLTVDDKHYAGWAESAGNGGLEGIVEYGLGYMNVMPGEINRYDPVAVLITTLTPKLAETRLYRAYVTALYGVKITDEGVGFVLYKQSVD